MGVVLRHITSNCGTILCVMLENELLQIIKGEVASDDATLEKYSTDASIFKLRPAAVVFPKDREDLKALVRFASAKKQSGDNISLTMRAAGTDMSGGPLSESIVVDVTRHLNRLIAIGKDYAIVEPGMYYRDFERAVAEKGLLLPPYPASKDLCAIGGMVANNAGGEKTLRYGKIEDYVEELTVILSDGEEHVIRPLAERELKEKLLEEGVEGDLYRKIHTLLSENFDVIARARPNVAKNSAGYFLWNIWDKKSGIFDLTKLIVGSQGTLCIVAEAKLRLIEDVSQKERHSHLAVIFLNDQAQLAKIVNVIVQFHPESVESYDDNTFKLALKFFPGFLKKMGAKNIVMLGIRFLPEFFLLLRGGIPKMVLLADFHGKDESAVHAQFDSLRKALLPFKVRVRGITRNEDAEKYWTIRRESFSLLREKVKNKRTAPFIDDVIVKPEYLPQFLAELNAILEPHKAKMVYTIAGHAGDGNFHIIPLMDLKDEESRALIPEIAEKVYDLVMRYGGSITAEHNDGLVRSPYLLKMYGVEVCRLFEEVKEIFDPLNIFNPGKKVGSDLSYALSHIAL